MKAPPPTALIAEDEPVLARVLSRELARLWPSLQIKAIVHDGEAAIEAARQHLPDILFMDIQMPERNGLDAVEDIIDDWPTDRAAPLVVFVTAFDRFAIDAFERAAMDYVLKPVEPQRLTLTCERLKSRLLERQGNDAVAHAPWHALRRPPSQEPPLTMIQAGIGSTLHMIATADIHYLEADSKYVRVVTQDRSLLIRTPLRELMPRLDERQFTQIHRSIVVCTPLIDKVVREDAGKIYLHLKGRSERLIVSRSYAHLFKPM
ncbi:DNA-binding response regulator [Aquabacterium soli]|uniref:DNA-binding response regulator n=1 Tax=Aquabacterium soli TaxID=2493092 RepID=A0A426VAY3_9BURK|nr:LytTR family DNA-binding domain-containing protein [Aquabacterium soli]RRS04107.1 DNA-binding response regulator [Aquabacterium soli]